MIGIMSDSNGDLEAIDAAYELLKGKGAKRFLFAGGRYADLDEWLAWRKKKLRGERYSDLDFLSDVSGFLGGEEQVDRENVLGGGRRDLLFRLARQLHDDAVARDVRGEREDLAPEALRLRGGTRNDEHGEQRR